MAGQFSSAESALDSVIAWLSSNPLTLNIKKIMALTPTSGTQPNSETFILRAHSCQSNFDESCNCPVLVRTGCIRNPVF